jgi:pimeloyl-ACP methyl ester carboxylesterase
MAAHIDGPLYFEQLGKAGPPMLFVHPNPMDHSCWIHQMDHFSTWYRTVSVDLPGYGKSPTAQPGLTVADLTEACWEVLDQVSRDPAIVVGLSVGWHTVMHMANQQPDRTLAIILSGCGIRSSSPPGWVEQSIPHYTEHGVAGRYPKILGDWSATFRQTEMARYYAQTMVDRNDTSDATSIVEIFKALGPHPRDPEWLFTGAKAPTLIITGSQDGNHAGAFDLQKKIPGCELVTMDGAGHACNRERPWEGDAHALRFLQQHKLVHGELPAAR